MQSGKICPVCEKDIGVLAVFIAAMPSRVHCPHCKSLLRYDGAGVMVAMLVAVILVCTAGAFFFLIRFYSLANPLFYFLWAAILVVLWLPLEFALAVYLRAAKVLRKVE